MSKQIVNFENPILSTVKEQAEEMIQSAFSDLIGNSATKAKVTITLDIELQEKEGALHPSIKHKINYNNTDSVKAENSEVKEETIHKSHIKGEAIHKGLQVTIEEDEVYTEESKTPLEKMADSKSDDDKSEE